MECEKTEWILVCNLPEEAYGNSIHLLGRRDCLGGVVVKKEYDDHITKDGVPIGEIVDQQISSEIDRVRETEMRKSSVGIRYLPAMGKFQNISGKKSEGRDQAKRIQSPEVIAHLNYLKDKGGIEAVHEHLNQPAGQTGSIEGALKDANDKVAFYAKEAIRIEQEGKKWLEIRDRLMQAYDILRGKVPTSSSNGTAVHTRGTQRDWKSAAETILKDGKMEQREFREKLGILFDIPKTAQTVYQATSALVMRKIIRRTEDGCYELEPQK